MKPNQRAAAGVLFVFGGIASALVVAAIAGSDLSWSTKLLEIALLAVVDGILLAILFGSMD
jgi:hypothetical protein